MTREELILQGKYKVRKTPSLMRSYMSLFLNEFGYSPNCASCSFESDWTKFIRGNKKETTKSITTMNNRTFLLNDNTPRIISFKRNGKTHHAYTHTAKDDFMLAFLTNGTEVEIAGRKKMFKKLPFGLTDEVAPEMQEWKESTAPEPKKTRAKRKK